MKWFVPSLACLCVGLISAACIADSVIYQQGQSNTLVENYDGVEDVTLISGKSHRGRNYGGANALWFGNSGEADDPVIRRSLIRFDLSSLQGKYKTIEQADLTLYVAVSLSEDVVVQAYAIKPENAGWVEGDAKGTGNPTGLASWAYQVNFTKSWIGDDGLGEPGDGYDQNVLATVVARKAGEVTFTLPGQLIQQWVESENAGLLLRAENEQSPIGLARFWSGEAPDKQPKLSVSYLPVSE